MKHGRTLLTLLIACCVLHSMAMPSAARTLLKNICRVKGQEQNNLHGLGLVVGLKGTGDSGGNLPTMRALARAMELMGSPLGRPTGRGGGLAELKKIKSVALVWVAATVPATGARSGDPLNCSVSVLGDAKSLAGGRLSFAALQGPNVNDPRVYALAEGRIHLDNPEFPTEGKVHKGARVVEDIFNPFHKDGKITLVLDKNHADFQVALAVSQAINSQLNYGGSESGTINSEIARPLDPMNIVVSIPKQYQEVPVEFVAQVMDLPIFEVDAEARVVVNERAGSIVISGEIEIGSVVVTHKNIVIETDNTEAKPFIPIDPEETDTRKLSSLVEALNKVRVPNRDVIEIIKGLERNGKLHGKLIIE